MTGKQRVCVIAEAGVNHNGSLDMAVRLVDAAAASGADAVKFQTFSADRLATRSVAKADYQQRATGAGESQYDMLKRLELDDAAHDALSHHCAEKGIEFLSTPFDAASADMLVERLGVNRLKVSSGDLTNAPLLLHLARTERPVILSTGMATLAEVEGALGVLAFGYGDSRAAPSQAAFDAAYRSPAGQAALAANIILLHCTSDYPAFPDDINLCAMDTLGAAFGLPVGYSDHTEGLTVSIAAAARGAVVIEKHFTLDRTLPGPDHRASLEPDELTELVRAVRAVESCLGRPLKAPAPSELATRAIARKAVVAATRIRRGECFTEANLTIKRAGAGLAPIAFWSLLGKPADRDYAEDEAIST
jgi:N-acetylneuraminate synthase